MATNPNDAPYYFREAVAPEVDSTLTHRAKREAEAARNLFSTKRYRSNHSLDTRANRDVHPRMVPKGTALYVDDKVVSLETNHETGSLPPTFDWRDHAALTPVAAQGLFSAGAAVAVASSLSDRVSIAGGGMRPLAAQALVSCTNAVLPDTWSSNLPGGDVVAYAAHALAHGLPTEADLPYGQLVKEDPLPCKPYDAAVTPSAIYRVGKHREDATTRLSLHQADENSAAIQYEIYTRGPVAAVMAIYSDFETLWESKGARNDVYFPGWQSDNILIASETWTREKPGLQGLYFVGFHGVVIVGWGRQTGRDFHPIDYWIVRNSIGTERNYSGGYFKIARRINCCGIESGVVALLPPRIPSLSAGYAALDSGTTIGIGFLGAVVIGIFVTLAMALAYEKWEKKK